MKDWSRTTARCSILTTTSARLQKNRIAQVICTGSLSPAVLPSTLDFAFKSLAAFIDREQTSDQVICQQNTSNYIKTPACLPAEYWWTCLFRYRQALCCRSMRSEGCNICWNTLCMLPFRRQLLVLFFFHVGGRSMRKHLRNEKKKTIQKRCIFIWSWRREWKVTGKMRRSSLINGQQARYTRYQSLRVLLLALLTVWSMTLCLCSCLGSASHFIYLSGTAACKRSSGAGLTYKADNGSIHASNLRAASALPN